MNILSKLASLLVAAVAVVLLLPTSAEAFCGFYVDGAGSEMFADATQVTLMREDTKTVLSMQNRYDGPPEDFALVIPVPVVLEEENVKTLKEDVFERVDLLTSPRLVEYFEKDPCEPEYDYAGENDANGANEDSATDDNDDVTVESQFKVGEYDISVLSTEDSTAMEDWLISNDYNIPDGAAPYFEPYVQDDMYFFVAQVDPGEVVFEDDQAVLSPLRFHYDSDDFSLPVRLGMINSRGEQDLIVNVLARDQRYELANYDNVTIPTNLEVTEEVADDFSTFYRALFAQTVEDNPGAAVTEYAWSASKCDPCPGPVQWGLPADDVETLGADVVPGDDLATSNDWVITRLHLRYGADDVGEDLIFEEADPIVGGREMTNEDGELESGAESASFNAFQGRYIIRHLWDEPIECDDPEFGRWGGPSGSENPSTSQAPGPNTSGEDVFGDGDDVDVDSLIVDHIDPHDPDARAERTGREQTGGCAAAPSGAVPVGALLVFFSALGLIVARRRR